ncbi:hypothetical protein ACH4VX_22895 [Streptomyces sp. NPDC020731]|uniref:hypothetical protein n=1 Tax=Streptomyces sp. NPDC020731 TaxID=3365085 RepID=UPI00379C2287
MRRSYRWVPDGRHGDQPRPPPLPVLNHVGPRNPDTVVAQPAGRHWQGTVHDGFHLYDGKLPVVVTGVRLLKEQGPAGAVFRRFGRPHGQTLLETIGNPRREAHDTRRQAGYEARERECEARPRRTAEERWAGREARRPVCAGRGTRFAGERWKALEPAGWVAPRDAHPAPA